MGKHLVVVGAGQAHLTVLKNLQSFTNSGHKVTVVSSSSFHYYSGMGDGTAVLYWHSLVFDGKPGFALKNHIDRKFMKNFQVSG